jgi:hypothetical protein
VKTCLKCRQSKPVSEFSKDKSRKDGLQDWCKSCAAEAERVRRAANRKRRGTPVRIIGDDEARFWSKVNQDGPVPEWWTLAARRGIKSPCHLWTNPPGSHGYGEISIDDRTILAHRYSLELHGIELDNELDCDHLCEVKACVRFEHLQQVEHAENMSRWRFSKALREMALSYDTAA